MTTEKTQTLSTDLLRAMTRRAYRLTTCPHEAADLVQDAALKIWMQRQAGADILDEQAYAMTVLHNLARSHWRARRPFDELQEDTASTLPDAPARIACAEMRAALLRLPAEQARLMALVAEGETSPIQLARLTGQPVGTVMSRLARARAHLRCDLGLPDDHPASALIG
ncbi:RNA polymerase sigma factor [Arenibacterium sp. CAU 1754]